MQRDWWATCACKLLLSTIYRKVTLSNALRIRSYSSTTYGGARVRLLLTALPGHSTSSEKLTKG